MAEIITSSTELTTLIFKAVSSVFIINDLKRESNEHALDNRKKLSIDQASILTGLAKGTLYSRVSFNSIPYIREGGRIFFYEDDLNNWITGRKLKVKKEVSNG